ncbi:MAG: PspC domain-containing protein [Jiangellaceae bacterium]|nr:PspC domain-containing protein [Jiangellaceae bacterium]
MTTTSAEPAGSTPDTGRSWSRTDTPVRTFSRRSDGRLVGGVATGLAEHLGLQPLTVRIGFAVLAVLGGFGIVLYLALWMFTSLDRDRPEPAGLAAATRAGRRRLRPPRAGDAGQLIALALLAGGLVLLFQHTPFGTTPALLLPLLLGVLGVALIWQTTDEPAGPTTASSWLARLAGGGWFGALRFVVGAAIVAVGVLVFLVGQGELQQVLDSLLGVAAILVGLGLIAGPWLWRLWRELNAERRERIVSQERADVAAHLHDSVLQTLALIQKHADHPREVVRLARSQERDLRSWLYADRVDVTASFAAALRGVAAEVEEAHGVPVEMVTVGDASLDERARALVSAVREAAVNAAKHSAAPRVDIYAEVEAGDVDVFVRDRGRGFDVDAVSADRLGIRHSIVDRMQRHGGSARIRSGAEEGTEVHLSTRRA